eukprot:4524578-Alexandrium_andersonii.AAC.1
MEWHEGASTQAKASSGLALLAGASVSRAAGRSAPVCFVVHVCHVRPNDHSETFSSPQTPRGYSQSVLVGRSLGHRHSHQARWTSDMVTQCVQDIPGHILCVGSIDCDMGAYGTSWRADMHAIFGSPEGNEGVAFTCFTPNSTRFTPNSIRIYRARRLVAAKRCFLSVSGESCQVPPDPLATMGGFG